MIDFSKVNASINIDTNFILSKIDEVQILYHYFGHFELGRNYPSKFRRDRNNSTGFYVNKNGRIIYNDFKTGEKLNCFTFVQKLYNCSFVEALNIIVKDFGLINNNPIDEVKTNLYKSVNFDREHKKNTVIQFIPGEWTNERIKYWANYQIDICDLKKEEVYPVNRLFINKTEIYNLNHLCFAYIVHEKDRIYTKIYSPFSERMKWISNIPITIPFGLHNLKYGTDHIIIGKAQKDRLILLKLFESVIGTQNESESALSKKLINHLKFQFSRRTIVWDSDEAGVENCRKFNSKGFGYFNTPKELLKENIKDVSDYVKEFGIKELEKLLKSKNIL
jgi:hypothetical protein